MVRYKVKPDRAAENESYIAKVFEQLQRDQPPGLRYASFKLADGNPLRELAAFKEFTARIKERCEEPPVAADLTEVGSYRFFGG
jgi:hypothetical protein